MDRGKIILISILAGIPILFVLFLLAITNVLLMLLGVVALLCAGLLIKRRRPELFQRPSREAAAPEAPPTNRGPDRQKAQVFMVLSGSEDFGARRIAVNKTSYSIGRSVDNDYVIDGGKISRHHVNIEYNPVENICYAIDAGSANGTYLNSVRMVEGQRYRLMQGDRLMIDDRSFVVEYAHY